MPKINPINTEFVVFVTKKRPYMLNELKPEIAGVNVAHLLSLQKLPAPLSIKKSNKDVVIVSSQTKEASLDFFQKLKELKAEFFANTTAIEPQKNAAKTFFQTI